MTEAATEGAQAAPHPLPKIVLGPTGGAMDWLELWRFRDLFPIIAPCDTRHRYQQTALGVAAVILQPLE